MINIIRRVAYSSTLMSTIAVITLAYYLKTGNAVEALGMFLALSQLARASSLIVSDGGIKLSTAFREALDLVLPALVGFALLHGKLAPAIAIVILWSILRMLLNALR